MSRRCDGRTGLVTREVLGMCYTPLLKGVTGEEEWLGTRRRGALMDTLEQVTGCMGSNECFCLSLSERDRTAAHSFLLTMPRVQGQGWANVLTHGPR